MLHVVRLVDKFYILLSYTDDRSVNANKIELKKVCFLLFNLDFFVQNPGQGGREGGEDH
jgi:hypothetical protein